MRKCGVIIIGSGAAGYGTADWLYKYGVTDVVVFTEDRLCGTSRNAGSDKQTYYKISLSEDNDDSVFKMAQTLYSGGGISGDDAMIMAANSARCFMRLVEYGVPFPTDEFGNFVGYKTDHDDTFRATSAGPLTSKYITECLEKKVIANGTEIKDGYLLTSLLVRDGVCYGAEFLKDGKRERVFADDVILCTGAPSGIYDDSVYPVGQTGATGAAIEAGAKLANFQEWQYGIASKPFRWNLSGSYQQVVPKYVSVDINGAEREFLSDEFTPEEACSRVFLKGWQWPFDYAKINGSSKIDLLVIKEIKKGNRVFLDYTANPTGFDFNKLSDEAKRYMTANGLFQATPFARLKKLNEKAAALFLSHGVNLEKERLEIGVAAQHNNGGIFADDNYETSIKHLFAAGESVGKFGVYRPGGAALNDTQVGGLRIARYLSKRNEFAKKDVKEFETYDLTHNFGETSNLEELSAKYKKEMSVCAGILRDYEKCKKLLAELKDVDADFGVKVKIRASDETGGLAKFRLTLKSQIALLETILFSIDNIGSRGGCICYKNGIEKPPLLKENAITFTDGGKVYLKEVRKLRLEKTVFEKLLNENQR